MRVNPLKKAGLVAVRTTVNIRKRAFTPWLERGKKQYICEHLHDVQDWLTTDMSHNFFLMSCMNTLIYVRVKIQLNNTVASFYSRGFQSIRNYWKEWGKKVKLLCVQVSDYNLCQNFSISYTIKVTWNNFLSPKFTNIMWQDVNIIFAIKSDFIICL